MTSDLLQYHLKELEIARDPSDPQHYLPPIGDGDGVILDVGCGIGQSTVHVDRSRNVTIVGLDMMLEPLMHGREIFNDIYFVSGKAEHLPFLDDIFDLVVSRVALPYSNVPASISEIARVLRPGGRVWLSLYTFDMENRAFWREVLRFNLKGVIWRSVGLLNGVALHFSGRVFKVFGINGYKSFQTKKAMRGLLKKNGFCDIEFTTDKRLIVTASFA